MLSHVSCTAGGGGVCYESVLQMTELGSRVFGDCRGLVGSQGRAGTQTHSARLF